MLWQTPMKKSERLNESESVKSRTRRIAKEKIEQEQKREYEEAVLRVRRGDYDDPEPQPVLDKE